MKTLSRLYTLALCLAACVLFPVVAFAQESLGSGITRIIDTTFSTAAIVALCSAIASVALACSKFLPGWATKANVVVMVATAVGGAVGALGPQAGAVAIIVAAFGAVIGYNRSDARAAR